MQKGVSMIKEKMKRFGLIMHVGTNKTASKSQFMYIPSISHTQEILNSHLEHKAIAPGQDPTPHQVKQLCEIKTKKTQMKEEKK